MSIYVTGDIHGADDVARLSSRRWPEGQSLKGTDYVIILGDFGFPWSNPPSKEDSYWLDWLDGRPWTTLFLDGNHENFDALETYPTVEMFGGQVHRLREHVYHLMRGHVFDIFDGSGGVSLYVMGGAASVDRQFRIEGSSWWSQEIPYASETERGWQALAERDFTVDYILTHQCSRKVLGEMYGESGLMPSPRSELGLLQHLDDIEIEATYRKWYFGHHHRDEDIDDRHTVLYRSIVRLGGDVS